MKADTLALLLRQRADGLYERANLLPAGEDAIPYAIAEEFLALANELDLVEDQ